MAVSRFLNMRDKPRWPDWFLRRNPVRPIRLGQIAASLYLDRNYDDAALTARQIIPQYPKHPIVYGL
jgi:hypothetical protein